MIITLEEGSFDESEILYISPVQFSKCILNKRTESSKDLYKFVIVFKNSNGLTLTIEKESKEILDILRLNIIKGWKESLEIKC